jgi:hypothetical protein
MKSGQELIQKNGSKIFNQESLAVKRFVNGDLVRKSQATTWTKGLEVQRMPEHAKDLQKGFQYLSFSGSLSMVP